MIYKAKLLITVLFDDAEVQPEFFQEATLGDLERLINDEAVGLHSLLSLAPVPAARVRRELRALGNDGTFFDRE